MSERPGVILDAGAFIQLERRDRTMVRLAQLFADARTPLVTSAAVVAQVWRGGEHHQVPIFPERHATGGERGRLARDHPGAEHCLGLGEIDDMPCEPQRDVVDDDLDRSGLVLDAERPDAHDIVGRLAVSRRG